MQAGVQQEIVVGGPSPTAPMPQASPHASPQPSPQQPGVVMQPQPQGVVTVPAFAAMSPQQRALVEWDVRKKVSSLNTLYWVALCLQLCVFWPGATSVYGILFWLQLACVLTVLLMTRSRHIVQGSLGFLKGVVWLDNLINLAYFGVLIYLIVLVSTWKSDNEDDDGAVALGRAFVIVFVIFALIVLLPVSVFKFLGLTKVNNIDPALNADMAARYARGQLQVVMPVAAPVAYASPYPQQQQVQYAQPQMQYVQPQMQYAQPQMQYAQPQQVQYAQPQQQQQAVVAQPPTLMPLH